MCNGIFKALKMWAYVFILKWSCNVNNKSNTIWLVQRLLASLTRKPRDTNALLILVGPQLQASHHSGCSYMPSASSTAVSLEGLLGFPIAICITFYHSLMGCPLFSLACVLFFFLILILPPFSISSATNLTAPPSASSP